MKTIRQIKNMGRFYSQMTWTFQKVNVMKKKRNVGRLLCDSPRWRWNVSMPILLPGSFFLWKSLVKTVKRNIRIDVPLNNRENISDPILLLRTKFVYHLPNLCEKGDPSEVKLNNQVVTVTQSNIFDEDNENCYAYDRNKCYTNRVSHFCMVVRR